MTLYARWARNSSGTTYQPIITDSENGTTTISPSRPAAGMTVTITAAPDEGYEVEKVVVADRNGNEIKVTDNEDGTYSFSQPAGSVTIAVTYAEEKCGGTEADNCPSLAFDDLDTTMWYHEFVDYVIDSGMMDGVADNLFAPETELTRGMIVTILWRLEGEPAGAAAAFDDVAEGQWYADAINWAAGNGIVDGYGDGTYRPDRSITREEMAVILYRYVGHKGCDVSASGDLSGFTDGLETSSWAVEAMEWATGAGLINGVGSNVLSPEGTATRAQSAAILMRLCESIAE